MTRTALVLLAVVGCAPAVASDARDEVCFSPPVGCAARLLVEIARAKVVRVQEYELTAPVFVDALIAAKGAGADVEVVLDRRQKSVCATLAAAGIPAFLDAAHAIAHNKVVLLQHGNAYITVGGSYNLSRAAEKRNAENMTIRSGRVLHAQYLENYRVHRAHSERCVAPVVP